MSNLPYSDSSRFFELRDPFSSRALRLETSDEADEWWRAGKHYLLARGEWQPERPLVLRGKMGGQTADFLWTTLVSVFCVSLRVIDLLKAKRLTGWATYPVEVYGRKGEHIPGYLGFAIVGPRLKRDRSRSPVVTGIQPRAVSPTTYYKGLYFDETEWDGSDFFRVDGSWIVTDGVQRVFKRARVTNVKFVPLPEVEIDVRLDRYSLG